MSFMFVYPNVSRAHTPQMGILTLASHLLDHGYDAFVTDLTFDQPSRYIDHVLNDIEIRKPEVVGFGLRSMELPIARELAIEIRKNYKDLLLVAGGPGATYDPDSLAGYVDFGVIGDGEDACLNIAKAMAQGSRKSIEDMPNVFFRRGEELIKNPLDPLFDLAQSPLPRYDLFDERHYTNHSFRDIVPHSEVCGVFEGSRGCPYRCTYCSNAALMDLYTGAGKWRREKPAAQMRAEIDKFRSEYGMDMMYFVDEVIMTTDERTAELRANLEDINIPFVFMERPELIRENRVKDMKAAGAYSCSIGVESGNEEYRAKILLRKMKDGTLKTAYRLMREHGVKTHAFIIMGLPDQSVETMAETFELLKELQPDTAQATTFFPLPATVLHDKVKAEGLYDRELYPTTYYESSVLNYSASHRRRIDEYAHMVNLQLWRPGRARQFAAKLCMTIPYVSHAMHYSSAVYRSVRRIGLRQTLYKIRRKIEPTMLHTGGVGVSPDAISKPG